MAFQTLSAWRRTSCAAMLLCTVSFAATRAAIHADPWTTAVQARAAFEAAPKGTHTRAEYARVMDCFRAIYHNDPADGHAARAVEQVAELLEEQGREFRDSKAVKDAVAQLDFLKRAYPGYHGEPLPTARVQGPGSRVQGAAASATTHGEKAALSGPPRDLAAVDEPPRSARDVATVTGIRHWSTATYTRLAIDLSEDGGEGVTYEAARVVNPDRIFFDLHHAKLAPSLAGRSFSVTDGGFLTRIRAAQAGGDVTRVVLDVPDAAEYSAFLLPNPERLIIDIHGRQGKGNSDAGAPIVREPAAASSAARGECGGVESAADAGDRRQRGVRIAPTDGCAAGAEYGEHRVQRQWDGGCRGERSAGQGGGDAQADRAAGQFGSKRRPLCTQIQAVRGGGQWSAVSSQFSALSCQGIGRVREAGTGNGPRADRGGRDLPDAHTGAEDRADRD